MSALDDLLSDFNSNAGTMPPVNPPESAKVLATQTAPEVAGQPEPEVVDVAPPPPTEKPAAVVAAEQAKARKPRQPRAPKAETAPTTNDGPEEYLVQMLESVQRALPEGIMITIQGRA